jgi:tRNA threonylcarbamoyladenosine biosynthesis protein TsaB
MSATGTLLAFDAAGRGCSAALWRDGRVLAATREAMRRGQAERLLPVIEATLHAAGVGWGGLDALAVTTGPGGFTGVRIGLATARGAALARGLPVLGIDGFEALAAATAPDERQGRTLLVTIDAKRADLYARAFAADLSPAGPPLALHPQALDAALPPGPLLLAGDAAALARPALEAAGRQVAVAAGVELVDPAVLARLAAARPWPAADAPPPRPLYLRPPDVTLPDAGGPR